MGESGEALRASSHFGENGLEAQRILVVSGDPGRREEARQHLVRSGFSVCVVGSGPELRERPDREPAFDLVLLDFASLSLAEPELEAAARAGSACVVLGVEVEGGRPRAPRPGAAEWLRESLASAELPDLIKRILEHRELAVESDSLRASVSAFERSRVLATCVEASDILPLGLEILLGLLERGGAVGRLRLENPEPTDEFCLRGFAPDLARTLGRETARGKLFDLEPGEAGAESRRGVLRSEWTRLGMPRPDIMEFWLRGPAGSTGAVWILGERRPFSSAERRAAEVVAGQMELALGNAVRFSEVRERAYLDDVTSLHNVRYLFSALRREIQRARRSNLDLSVLFLDLDRFKRVNDRHGHLVGSAVLREFGELLKQGVRSIDTVGRYGGDEFAMVLVDTPLEGARGVAERIRREVEARRFEAGSGLGCQVTVSIGAASFPGDGTEAEDLIDRADRAMYRAKAQGRNRVCTDDARNPGDPPD